MASITANGSKHSHKFTLTVTETGTNTANNTSTVKFSFTVYKSSYSWSGWDSIKYSIKINGTTYTGTIPSYTAGDTVTIKSGSLTIGHNADGTKSISYSFSVTDNSGQSYTCGNASASGTMELSKIPRYASLSHSLNSKTLNSIKINWSSDSTCDQVQYRIGSGNWITASSTSASSGSYTINSLNPATAYSIYTRVRRKDNQLYTTSSALSVTTYDKAKISSVGNFEHGNDASVSITNPGNVGNLSLVMKIENTQILSRTVKAGNNTITFSDTELDNLYKMYGSSSSVTATFTLSGSGYTHSSTCTITFKGNQKTARIKNNNEWKRGKIFVKIDGIWRKAILWINVNGIWKRGI